MSLFRIQALKLYSSNDESCNGTLLLLLQLLLLGGRL